MTDASPNKGGGKWSARMGTALRRSSTLLAISRPSTPSASGNVGSDKDSDGRSLRRSTSGNSLGASQAAIPTISAPSPIAESPAREAAAMQEALGPSPLAQSSSTDQSTNVGAPTVEEQTSPTGYVPPPVLDSTVGNPGAFTDDPDILPQTQTVLDPYAVPEDEPTAVNPIERSSSDPIFAPVMAESMKSAESLSMPVAAAPASLVPEPMGQDRVNDGFNTAVMPPHFPAPGYNVWASGSSQDVDNRSIAMPVAVAPSQTSSIRVPEPRHPGQFKDPYGDPHHPHSENHETAHSTILMPLPAFNDVVEHPAHHEQSLGGSKSLADPEADERVPLLSRGVANNYSHVEQPTSHTLVGSSSSRYANGNFHVHLSDLGWVEYSLPDGTTYYSHLNRKLTTDLDLRSERILRAVTLWVEERENEGVTVDVEGWLVELKDKPAKAKKKSGGWGRKDKKDDEPVDLERWWVDHQQRSVTKGITSGGEHAGYGRNHGHSNGHDHGKGKKQATQAKIAQEDHLDLEYRYWAFMESHPAHLPVSRRAKAEALDVLTWALTDRLLPSHRAIPAPFTQDECQELRNILISFNPGNESGDNGIQTRIIARILLRVAHWRQIYFRPTKPLPKDVQFGGRPFPIHEHRPFRRAFFDFIISCICLGIPYFFLERVRLSGRSSDEESGLLRGPAPIFIIGACTCLMAALVLSASVTFLSLPGLDGLTRSASMVAGLFAAFAVAATGVAVLRHKADLERPISHLGVEGIAGISRRTIALSLPVVFLAYSIVAFVAALTLYSFRGKVENPLPKSPFDDYTRWIVVGVLGGLAGILTTSFLLLRR